MKQFAFISDFDGTISTTDFYIQILRSHLPEQEQATIAALRSGEQNDFDVLNHVFSSMNLDENGLAAEIARIPVDSAFTELVADVERAGGDFILLSAGCAYYIGEVLKSLGLERLERYGNLGVYDAARRGLVMRRDAASPYYSERYGVDKAAVVRMLSARYKTLFYAGDSLPDIAPGLLCDVRFAKAGLARHYTKQGVEHFAVEGLSDIRALLPKVLASAEIIAPALL